MNIHIKKATKEDVFAIRHIMDEAVTALPDRGWYIDDDESFIGRHIDKEGYVLTALADDRIVGFLLVRRPKDAPDNLGRFLEGADSEPDLMKISHIESMAVFPECSGYGIVTALLKEAKQIEQAAGICCLMATVHPENIPSRRTFEKAGFSVVCQTEMYGKKPRLVLLSKP